MHGYSRKSFTMLLRAMISLFMFRYHHLQNLPHSFTDFFIANSQIHVPIVIQNPKLDRQNFICITIELIILSTHSQ